MNRKILFAACLLGGLAVAFGAFGAHLLKDWLISKYGELAPAKLEIWNTGVKFQMYHALAMLAMAFSRTECRRTAIAAICFGIGVLIFSGCLYALVLTGLSFFGAIVPIGGTFMIIGWIVLASTAFPLNKTESRN